MVTSILFDTWFTLATSHLHINKGILIKEKGVWCLGEEGTVAKMKEKLTLVYVVW